MILEVNISGMWRELRRYTRQRQIMRGDKSDGPAFTKLVTIASAPMARSWEFVPLSSSSSRNSNGIGADARSMI